MKKTKLEKGITLIALIITIIILLILAVVVIGAVQESKIIVHAENAKERYQIEKIEEKIKSEKAEMKLDEYEKDITVTDILHKYGDLTDPVSIASNAKSVPENMPAGNYYILTPDKYAFTNKNNIRRYAKLTTRGEEREENILKDVYVINEQLDIYYIIEANIVSQQMDIDHDAIGQILVGLMTGTIDQSLGIQGLKDEGAIEQETVDLSDDMAVTPFMDETMGFYFYKINALYKMQQTDDGITVSYVEENVYPLQYKLGKCAIITKETLEDIFLNKSKTELEKILSLTEKEFLEYIVNNSNRRIKSIDKIKWVTLNGITLGNLELRDENGNEIILEAVNEEGEKVNVLFGYDIGYTVKIGGTDYVIIDVHLGT